MSSDVMVLSDDCIFYTIEGEGHLVGVPSVFIRLSNCNLTCQGFASKDSPYGCDSYISWRERNTFTFDEINKLIEKEGYDKHLKTGAVLKITGGEPMLQQSRLIKWLKSFEDKFKFIPRIDIETNGTLQPQDVWIDELKATFTVSPKMSANGDDECIRYKPEVLEWHNKNKACFKFVITSPTDISELYDKYIDNKLIDKDKIWLMPCCGSRREHIDNAQSVAELCKSLNLKFSPRLQLIIWDMALKA